MNLSRFRATVSSRRVLETASVGLVESLHRPESTTGAHAHSSPRLCLVVAGAFEETDPNGRWQRDEGTLLMYPPEAEHEDRFSVRGARCLNIELPALPSVGSAGRRRVTDLGVRLASVALFLYDELRRRADRRALQTLVDRLLDGLGERSGESDTGPSEPVARARHLVQERAAEGITLSEVARDVGVSRFALARDFRAETGFSVGEYRHHLQVVRARAALLSTDASLSAVAYRTGFADQSHFTRIFKRWTGLPPGHYRAAED